VVLKESERSCNCWPELEGETLWKERPCDGSCLIITVDLIEWILCCCTSCASVSCCSLEIPFWLSGRRILMGVRHLQSLLLAVEELSCAAETEALTFFEVLLLDKLGFWFWNGCYIHIDYALVNFLSCPGSRYANKLKWITIGERLMLIISPTSKIEEFVIFAPLVTWMNLDEIFFF